MADYSGYKPIFDKAAKLAEQDLEYKKTIEEFRNHPDFFHFIMAPPHQKGPDDGSLDLAKKIDHRVYEDLIRKGPSDGDRLDGVESRHVLLMTYLINNLGPSWGNVLEIGGGYGNCLRLVDGLVDYSDWSIVDLPFISELQKDFLAKRKIFPNYVYNTKFESYDLKPNLVIGTHSLSEFSIGDFIGYFDKIQESDWFFYVGHNSNPSPELLSRKMDIISESFNAYNYMQYEGSACTMFIFKNKALSSNG